MMPLPLSDADRAAGYWWELSMRQIEVSRTIVFGAPRHARGFFEALVADNIDLGRPDSVEIIFRPAVQRRGRPSIRTGCQDGDRHPRQPRSPSTSSTSTPGSSSTSRMAVRCVSRPLSTPPTDLGCQRRLQSTSMSCRPAPVRLTAGCSMLNVPVRVASLRVQPLSGLHSPLSPMVAGGPRP